MVRHLRQGRLGVVEADSTVRTYGPEHGLGVGPYYSIYEDSRGALWIGGTDGLNRWLDGRFIKIDQTNRFRGSVFAMVEDADGDLWLGTGSGIACLNRADLEKAADAPAFRVRSIVLDPGMDLPAFRSRPPQGGPRAPAMAACGSSPHAGSR